MSSDSFKYIIYKMRLEIIHNIYKIELALNNLQWLISHKTQTNPIIYI